MVVNYRIMVNFIGFLCCFFRGGAGYASSVFNSFDFKEVSVTEL